MKLHKYTSANQIKVGSYLSYLNIFLSIVVNLIFTPILIRSLGKNEYGLYNSIYSIISAISLLNLGLGSGYVHFFAVFKKRGETDKLYSLNGLFLLLFSFLGLIALGIGIFFSFNLNLIFASGLTAEEYILAKKLMILLSINLCLFFPSSVFQTIINSEEKFVYLKCITILRTLLTPVVTVPFLLLGYKSFTVVIITVSISLVMDFAFIYYVLFVLKHKFIFKNFEKGILKKLFTYTIFVAIHLLVDEINNNIDQILLGRFCGTAEIANYSVALTLKSYYSRIATAIPVLYIPMVHFIEANSEFSNEKKFQEYTNVFIKVGRIQWLISGLFFWGLIFFGFKFITIWAGDDYAKSYFIMLLLIIPFTIDVVQNIGIEIQRAQNKHYFRAFAYLIMAIVNVFISIFFIKLWGAIGAALGTAISYFVVQGLIMNFYYKRKCGIDVASFWRMFFSIIIKTLPVIVTGVFLMIISNGDIRSFISGISVFSVLYILFVLLFCSSKDEKQYLKRKFSRKV